MGRLTPLAGRLTALLAIGGLITVSGCASPTTPTAAPATGASVLTPGPGGSGAPSAGPGLTPGPGEAFVALPDFPAADAFEVTGVTATANGFLAVGFGAAEDEDYFGLRQGITWRSSDGTSWQEAIDPAFANVTPLHVASLGANEFLVGILSACPQYSEEECTDLPEAGYAIWRSAGGGPWELLPQHPSMKSAAALDELLAGHDRLAVTGTAGDEAETAMMWTSADGVTWSESADLAGLDPITALAAGPQGYVAFGTELADNEESVTIISAASADGAHFTRTTVPARTNAAIEGATAGTSGLVGVGYGENQDFELSAAALFSVDGTAWLQAADSDGSMASSGMLEVHPLNQGFVGLGFTPDEADFAVQVGQSWISRDGQSWRALAPFGGEFSIMTASAIGTSGLILFTADQEETEVDVTSSVSAWFAPGSSLVP